MDLPLDESWRGDRGGIVDAAGFLLCGGKSSRMGTDKALLMLNGERLVERGLRTLHEVCTDVAIAGGAAGLDGFGRVVPDPVQECGPLGGIVAALEQSSKEWNLFLPVDAPFVPAVALKQLLSIAAGSSFVDVLKGVEVKTCIGVIARAGGRLHPLCAVYAQRALPALRKELTEGRLKVTQAIAAAGGYEVVDFADESWFRNLNTPDEFAAASRFGS